MATRPTIAVVGASVRATAFSLLNAGVDVVAADLFADADLARVCPVTRIADYPAGLADWLANTPCDGWLYTGALENHPELIDRMAELRPLLGNRGDVLRRVRDPLLLQETLTAAGLNFPKTKSCAGNPPGAGDWLHKTGQGGNGSGVQRATVLVPVGTGYWQRRIAGDSGSAIFIDDQLQGVTRQLVGQAWLGSSNFQYCGTLAPWNLPRAATADLIQLGQVLRTQYHLRGIFGIDFIFDGEQVWPVEVNSRVTAAVEVVERVSGSNLLAEHLIAFGIKSECPKQSAVTAGKVILYAKQPLTISQLLCEQLLVAAGPHGCPQLADIPPANTKISAGEPILTLLASGHSTAEVENDLRQRVVTLEREFYRDGGGNH